MKEINKEKIEKVLNNEFAKISEVRLMIAAIEKLEDLAGKEEFYTQLQEKLGELTILYKKKQINYQPVLNGFLSLGGKPGIERLNELKTLETNTVVTLLKVNEKGVEEIEVALASHQIAWIWYPLSASELQVNVETKEKINQVYETVIEKLEQGERIFIHCAAGVHRTGSFTNGLLRKIGYSSIDSKQLIKKMRPVTALEAVKKHWNWSGQIFTP